MYRSPVAAATKQGTVAPTFLGKLKRLLAIGQDDCAPVRQIGAEGNIEP